MTRTERPAAHGRTAQPDTDCSGASGSERAAASDVAVPALTVAAVLSVPATVAAVVVPLATAAGWEPAAAAVGAARARGGSSVLVPFGVAATVVAGGALASAVRRVDARRQSIEGAAGRVGDADPDVLSLVAEPYATVEGTHRRLRALERLLRERGDRRAVFLTVYVRVTGEVAAAIERGAFEDPEWVADYLVRFADRYRRAVYDFETGRTAALPTAWRLAFRAAGRERAHVLQHAALGINAHVTFDLAFALLAAGVDDGRRAKHVDHQRINLVLWRLVDVTLDRLAERYAPGVGPLVDAVGPLVEVLWFGGLVLGRECAWWVALVLVGSGSGSPARLARWFLAVASAAVARAVLGPTARTRSRPTRDGRAGGGSASVGATAPDRPGRQCRPRPRRARRR
ncbi:MAG: DUF5995 family protein [Haloarculaceae archaeon]